MISLVVPASTHQSPIDGAAFPAALFAFRLEQTASDTTGNPAGHRYGADLMHNSRAGGRLTLKQHMAREANIVLRLISEAG